MFNNKLQINIHVQAVHNNETYECEQCKKSFSTKQNMMAHLRTIHNGVKIECQVCFKESGRTHIKVHEENCRNTYVKT